MRFVPVETKRMRCWWLVLLLLVASCASSIRIVEKRPGEPFAFFAQALDATPYRGQLIVVSARLKSAGIPQGPNGVWLRADGSDRKLLGFASSYLRPVIGDSDWTERKAVLDIDAQADRIVFGAMNSSTGKLLVDDLRVQPIESLPIDRPSTVASDYLQDALEKIRHRAYYSDRVDWVRARSNAFLVASGAQTPYETYDAVRYALRLLGDHHSFLVEPAQVREQAVSTARDFGITGTTLAGIGYIAVPGYNGQNTERSDAFSSAIQEHIAHAQAAQACRWIVDLRNNTGGNMYPMLAGLHPLLGDEPLGYFYNRAGEWHPWSARKGASIAREASNDVVAIITGRETASSGEAVTLSFRGRPHTRSFGEATAGYSTANQSVALSDGAQIALTSGLMADRHRNVANGSIQPDEIVDVPNTVQFKDDPAIRAATAWLRTQPCADSPR